jgi:hypothetical protein
MMRVFVSALLLLCIVPAQSSHLSQEEVDAMLQACEDAREKKLMPEREALVQQCVASGEGDLATCHEKHANYGERTTGAIRMLGKYYALPECEDAYQARKHYKLNPGR